MADYAVLGRVATTRSGAVWKAHDRRLDRLVALKELAAPAEEAARLASLHSAHVVALYGVVEDAGRSYLVEEWVEGATLAAIRRQAGRLSAAHALAVVRGALLGLVDVHRAGLVHGDISLSNIMVDAAGTSKLIDFGSVVRAGERARASTSAFAAPEARRSGPLTPATDVYAAAAVLAMLMHGRAEQAPSTRGVDAGVRPVLDKALADDPAERYPDAAAFLAALEEAGERRYGAAWWTQAGLGALAASSAAELVDVPDDAPFRGHGRASGASTTANEILGLEQQPEPGPRIPRRTQLVAGGAVLAVIAVVALVFAATGGDTKQNHALGGNLSSSGGHPGVGGTTGASSSSVKLPSSELVVSARLCRLIPAAGAAGLVREAVKLEVDTPGQKQPIGPPATKLLCDYYCCNLTASTAKSVQLLGLGFAVRVTPTRGSAAQVLAATHVPTSLSHCSDIPVPRIGDVTAARHCSGTLDPAVPSVTADAVWVSALIRGHVVSCLTDRRTAHAGGSPADAVAFSELVLKAIGTS